MSWVVGGAVLVTVVVSFVAARLFAARLNSVQRRLTLYILAFGGTFVLVGANKEMNDGVIMLSFLAIIAAFFAMLTAPDRP